MATRDTNQERPSLLIGSHKREEAKPLTDLEITAHLPEYSDNENYNISFFDGAIWARERLLESMLQEVEKAWEACVCRSEYLNGVKEEYQPNYKEFVSQIKEKYGL